MAQPGRPGRKDRAVDSALIRDVVAGDFRAVARLITLSENRPQEARPYLEALSSHTGGAFTIGVTGAAGSGKSTLVDRLAARYRASGERIGIIAVDPSSPYSGGAILGDRIRMQSHSLDAGTFIRSMATRGQLGGLARATLDALLVLDAAGFKTILLETVGVGQDEVEVARTADATLVLVVPGMGDEVQAMKAGIMEIADVFVLNKADRPGADGLAAQLEALVGLAARRDGWQPPIVRTVATEDRGIDECARAVADYRKFCASAPASEERRGEIAEARLLALVRSRITEEITGEPRLRAELSQLALRVARRELDPFSAADRLMRAAGIRARSSDRRPANRGKSLGARTRP